jgi:hypothetical protein
MIKIFLLYLLIFAGSLLAISQAPDNVSRFYVTLGLICVSVCSMEIRDNSF